MFEPSSHGDQLVGEPSLRDYAEGQDVDLVLGNSPNAFGLCVKDTALDYNSEGYPWIPKHTDDHQRQRPSDQCADRARCFSAYSTIRGAGKGLAVRDGSGRSNGRFRRAAR